MIATENIFGSAMTFSVATDSGQTAYVRIAGDVDLAGDATLTAGVNRLRGGRFSSSVIDLGEITFAGPSLLKFLYAVVAAMPEAAMDLCRPTPFIRQLIEITCLDAVATLCDDLPPRWPRPAMFIECPESATRC